MNSARKKLLRKITEKGLEQLVESVVIPAKQDAPSTIPELLMPERPSMRQSIHPQRPCSTVEGMETEVGLPPDEPKWHLLDG